MAGRALVIGGSIAGLFAANALRRIGWDVTVFERVGEPLAGRGAGIGTHSELIAVLRRLGLPVDETIGVQVPMRICLDRSGRVTHVEGALKAYDRGRRPFGSWLVARGRRLGAYIEARLRPPAERTESECQPPPEFLMREIGTISLQLRQLMR